MLKRALISYLVRSVGAESILPAAALAAIEQSLIDGAKLIPPPRGADTDIDP